MRRVLALVLVLAAAPVPARAQSPTGMPTCVNQVTSVNSRCERWARAFNDRSPDGSTVDDTPAGVAVSRGGDKLYVATTSHVGASREHITVAALSTKSGATLWLAHPPTPYTTDAFAIALSPDGGTVVVAGTLTYLPSLNSTPIVWVFTSAYATANGRMRWAQVHKVGAVGNVPVAVRWSPRGDRVFVAAYSAYPNYGRTYVEWLTLGYSAGGKELWYSRYGGQAGGQNFPVALVVSPHGDRVYVVGTSDHPQTTGQFSSDYAAVAYDARTGKQRWVSITRSGSNQFPVGATLSPKGDRLYLTGSATFGTETSPVSGGLTVALSTTNGKRAWTLRQVDASGLSSTPYGIVANPHGDVVYVAAAVGRRRVVVEGALEPAVVTMTTYALDAKSGHQKWAASYAPDPSYSAMPTALAVSPKGSTVYVAGVVGPPGLTAAYPVVVAVSSKGATSWVARYDVRDPGGAGVAGNFPAFPRDVVVDPSGANVYVSLAYEPVGEGAASAECNAAHGQGVAQGCDPTGESDFILAYAK